MANPACWVRDITNIVAVGFTLVRHSTLVSVSSRVYGVTDVAVVNKEITLAVQLHCSAGS